MLTEFAFTHSIFDEDAHTDKEAWRQQLLELGIRMFPHGAPWNIVVADLYDASWNHVACQRIAAIKDHKAKDLCARIFQNIHKVLVSRPACGAWPNDDCDWVREALETARIEAIDRIISDPSVKTNFRDENNTIRTLEEVEDAGFWSNMYAGASPRMVFEDQFQLLRKLCLHSQWLAFINPYISSSEMSFAVELLRRALNRPASFGKLQIEFHTTIPDDWSDQQTCISNFTADFTRKAGFTLKSEHEVSFYFWSPNPSSGKKLERRLIAGNVTTDSSGAIRNLRWGVAMNHVARKDDPNADPTHWSLIRREDLNHWYERYIRVDAENKPQRISLGSR